MEEQLQHEDPSTKYLVDTRKGKKFTRKAGPMDSRVVLQPNPNMG